MTERSTVPCNGCTACCRGQLVMLQPDEDPSEYEVAECNDPLTGKPGHALLQKSGGDCIYLIDGGCSIYERAPKVCRSFDCRKQVARWAANRAERRRLIKDSGRDPVIMAGVERLDTLTPTERAVPWI